MSENRYNWHILADFFSHSIARKQCFITLIIVKDIIIFSIFGSFLKFLEKNNGFSTFSFAWN
jgi:hypothetical protein